MLKEGRTMTDDRPIIDRTLPDPDLLAVAGYRLLRRIGVGGMSSVFQSYDVAAGNPVAVKILADHLAHSREFVSRFYREARLSRLLSHPYLIQGLAAGYDADASKHYLILEYVDGPTAQKVLNRLGSLPVGVAVKIGLDIAQALSFMHARQYVHRDVKPDNILLHPDGVAKLADLGLAKRLNDDAHLTAVNQGVGTSYYMSYEQSQNSNFVDGRSDIFALGATLYHLLAGEVPFPGATHEEIIREKEHDTYSPLEQRNPQVPVNLAAIIARTLSRDPRSRFQSAEELAAALEATGLATRIPKYPKYDGENIEENADCPSDIPTRADLKTSYRKVCSPSTLSPPTGPTISFIEARKAVSSQLRNARTIRPYKSIRYILSVVALTSAIGLGGVLAAWNRSHAKPPQPPVTRIHQSSNPGTGGLPVPIPQ
jgi:serine/threonine-protein kinase